MELSADSLYQIVRVGFAISLLGFLFLVVRTTMKELQEPLTSAIRSKPTMHAELVTVPGESESNVPDGLVFDIQGVATLGRSQSSRVTLDDSSVSAQHALIRPSDGTWTVEDMGSRNGTMVNGKPIAAAVALECGDSIQLGRVRLRLMC